MIGVTGEITSVPSRACSQRVFLSDGSRQNTGIAHQGESLLTDGSNRKESRFSVGLASSTSRAMYRKEGKREKEVACTMQSQEN